MIPHRPAHRRPSAHEYRLRRAIVATAVVLVVFGIVQLTGLAGDGGGDDEVTATTEAPATTTTTIPDPPECAEGNVESAENPNTEWSTIIIDTERALPHWYVPADLTNISEAGFPFTDGMALRGFVMADLGAMREAAAENGTPFGLIATYRSYERQRDLYDRRVGEMGQVEAGSRVARPGHSEHQLGTTIDVGDEGATDVDQAWGASPTGQWIASNAHKYGFLISYPAGAVSKTCFDFEPWHLRYVGRDLAAQVVGSGLTLRHYLHLNHPPAASEVTATTEATTTTLPADPG